MKVDVLRDFPYSADGIRSTILKAGTTADVNDTLVEGLRKEGFIQLQGQKSGTTQPGTEDQPKRTAAPIVLPLKAKHVGGGKFELHNADGDAVLEGRFTKDEVQELADKLKAETAPESGDGDDDGEGKGDE